MYSNILWKTISHYVNFINNCSMNLHYSELSVMINGKHLIDKCIDSVHLLIFYQ